MCYFDDFEINININVYCATIQIAWKRNQFFSYIIKKYNVLTIKLISLCLNFERKCSPSLHSAFIREFKRFCLLQLFLLSEGKSDIYWLKLRSVSQRWTICSLYFHPKMRFTFSQRLFSKGMFSAVNLLPAVVVWGSTFSWWESFTSVHVDYFLKFSYCFYSIQTCNHLAALSCGICSDTSSCLDLTLQINFISVSVTCINGQWHNFTALKY